jgi:hypothetical protein
VGEMPIMAADLASVPRQHDPRVRRATAADVDAVTDLIEEAYGFAREIAALAAAPLRRGAWRRTGSSTSTSRPSLCGRCRTVATATGP